MFIGTKPQFCTTSLAATGTISYSLFAFFEQNGRLPPHQFRHLWPYVSMSLLCHSWAEMSVELIRRCQARGNTAHHKCNNIFCTKIYAAHCNHGSYHATDVHL